MMNCLSPALSTVDAREDYLHSWANAFTHFLLNQSAQNWQRPWGICHDRFIFKQYSVLIHLFSRDQRRETSRCSEFVIGAVNSVGHPSRAKTKPAAPCWLLCQKCFTAIGQGIPHSCNRTSKLENVVKTMRPRMKEKQWLSVIKKKASDTASVTGEVALALKQLCPPRWESTLVWVTGRPSKVKKIVWVVERLIVIVWL